LVDYQHGKEVPITTETQWQKKREWIKEQYQYWISGHFPPAPDNLKATILSDTVSRGVRIQMIQLGFGPGRQAKMTLELMIPDTQYTNEHPVFMTQWNHRDWAQLAVKRGYIACVYAAADLKDDTDSYMYIYPEYDFTGLARRAWGA